MRSIASTLSRGSRGLLVPLDPLRAAAPGHGLALAAPPHGRAPLRSRADAAGSTPPPRAAAASRKTLFAFGFATIAATVTAMATRAAGSVGDLPAVAVPADGAVNLRDIGEASPKLRKGLIYRCGARVKGDPRPLRRRRRRPALAARSVANPIPPHLAPLAQVLPDLHAPGPLRAQDPHHRGPQGPPGQARRQEAPQAQRRRGAASALAAAPARRPALPAMQPPASS
jgi:hypothetical protein